MQSSGKQKPEVLSQPYWCWSLICMCYQPISLGTHTLTQRHTHTHTPHARTHKARSHVHTGSRIVHKHRHAFTQRLRFHTEYRCLLPPPSPPPHTHLPHIPSHIYTRTFSTKLTPLCTRRPANVQVLQKKSAYPSVWGKERWELLISHSAFLSLSKYKMYIFVSPACIKNSDPRGLYFTKQYIHCSLQLPQQIRYVHKLQCKKTVLYGSVHV